MNAIITLYAAVALNGVIGNGGAMPWRLPSDLKRFKSMTLGKPIIMGRKTFESIGKPLPQRVNIVVSRSKTQFPEGVISVSSFEEALTEAEKYGSNIAVIGGGEIYRAALPYADQIVITRVLASPEGDTFFPEMAGFHLESTIDCPQDQNDTAVTHLEVYKKLL